MSGPKDARPLVGTERAQRVYSETDARIIRVAESDRKEVANALALAARDGFGLYELAAGGFLLTRSGMARELPDVRAVLTLLQQMRSL